MRRSRKLGVATALGIGCLAAVVAGSTFGLRAAAETSTADAVMREVEARLRSAPRFVQLDIKTKRPRVEGVVELLAGEPIRLWGAINGDPQQTRILFVFTAPERMQGTGLLIVDPWSPQAPDTLWYHMRTFRRFLEIQQTSLKLLVPGTCLTYEDARGFLSSDKYSFRFLTAPVPTAREWQIEARPRSPELERDLGVSSLKVHVDRARFLVQRIDYIGLNGLPVKTYELEAPVRFGDRWLPGTARVNDLQSSIESVLHQQYWRVKERLPDTLFDVSVEDDSLFERMRSAGAKFGVRIE
ncbi:MAG TPA: outer membrane lipoprotein-sorting protein [Thermoanaerobaculia bacterium]|nr:outer membrane lipoprotein-sorting protein [Thermoanaerobaculia bacterium]